MTKGFCLILNLILEKIFAIDCEKNPKLKKNDTVTEAFCRFLKKPNAVVVWMYYFIKDREESFI